MHNLDELKEKWANGEEHFDHFDLDEVSVPEVKGGGMEPCKQFAMTYQGLFYVHDPKTERVTLHVDYDEEDRSFSKEVGTFDFMNGTIAFTQMGAMYHKATVLDLAEGDWLSMDYDLAAASAASGVSQYELLTGLAQRFARG